MKSIVLIDVGNTRVKVAHIFLDQLEQQRSIDMEVFPHQILDRLPEWVSQQKGDVIAAYGVNVAGQAIGEMIERFMGDIHIKWVKSQPELLGLVNQYDIPEQLGADRFLGLLGAYRLMKEDQGNQQQPILIASLGTATTVDCLYQNHFLGGIILPGLMMMQRSLAGGTAQLPLVQFTENTISNMPKNTKQAILSGVLNAQVGAIMAQWYYLKEYAKGQIPRIYITGGARPLVLPRLSVLLQKELGQLMAQEIQIVEVDSLVLEGLRFYCKECIYGN